MNFQPIVPFGGYSGWVFLQRTREDQQAALDNAADTVRASQYFRANIGAVSTAEDLVGDRRLLSVALGAFGLEADIGNRAFIRDVLAEGTIDPQSLANKLTDKRYLAMSAAFGFDLGVPSTKVSDFADRILSQYRDRAFETAVGARNEDMRLALSLGRDLGEVADKTISNDGKWFAIMGNPPLRRVFEMALGLPASFGSVDIDRQLKEFRDRADAVFGTTEVADIAEPEREEKLLRLFLLRSGTAAGAAAGPGTVALQLLQAASVGTLR